MVQIENYFCINKNCKYYGIRNKGNIIKAGTYGKGNRKKQLLKCNVCGQRFSETRNTIFFNSNYTSKTIRQIISCVAEGNGVRSTSRILELDKNAVNNVILKAGNHCEIILSNLLKSLHLEECQLDELWSFVRKKNSIRKGFGKGIWADMDMDSDRYK
jgi:transposase-like protein